jgi:hypothetical protein
MTGLRLYRRLLEYVRPYWWAFALAVVGMVCVAAGDLINAHLCAGQVPSEPAPSAVPPSLACAVIGPQIAATLQAGGFHEDVTDLPQQLEAACEVGNWSIELRTCFAGTTSIDALKACIHAE